MHKDTHLLASLDMKALLLMQHIQGELGHESDYLFKLNIHAQDYRLYGRRVAEKTMANGRVVVLIAFDQIIAHNQALKLEAISASP